MRDFKKNNRHSFRTAQRCQRVKELALFYSTSDLCRALELPRSSYYAWLKRQADPKREQQMQDQKTLLQSVFSEFRGAYGSPRITHELKRRGHCFNHKRVERLMRQQGLAARRRRRFRVKTTDSHHDHPIAPNRLVDRRAPTGIDQVWVADITFIPTREGWFYLAAVMDLYSRKIIGWAMQENLETSLALNALQMALKHRQPFLLKASCIIPIGAANTPAPSIELNSKKPASSRV